MFVSGTLNIFPNSDILSSVLKWNVSNKPIIIIGSEGIDPIDRIKTFALEHIDSSRLKQIWVNNDHDDDDDDQISTGVNWALSVDGWLLMMITTGSWTSTKLNKCLLNLNLENSNARIWLLTSDTNIPPLLAAISINIILQVSIILLKTYNNIKAST